MLKNVPPHNNPLRLGMYYLHNGKQYSPDFHQFKTFGVQEMVDVNSMVSMYKVYNTNLLPTNIPSYFQKVNAIQIITSIRKNCSFEIRFN